MVYADYNFYIEKFIGKTIKEVDFERLALRASQFLDYYTMDRAKHYTRDDAVKNACCAVAETYQNAEQMESKSGVASESVGSYSVSYRDGKNATEMLAIAARQYLAFTGLLSRGGC